MTARAGTPTRADEILSLLVTHEALSFSALRALLPASLCKSRLRKVLDRLLRDGSVRRRVFSLSTGRYSFYEPGEHPGQSIPSGYVHSSRLFHNDLCALAAATLRRMYPASVCVREHAIPRYEKLRDVMRYQPSTRDSLPDLLLLLPSSCDSGPVYVVPVGKRLAVVPDLPEFLALAGLKRVAALGLKPEIAA